jgi:hypothetical protein
LISKKAYLPKMDNNKDEEFAHLLQLMLAEQQGNEFKDELLASALRSGSVQFWAQNIKNWNCNWSIVSPNLAKTEPNCI